MIVSTHHDAVAAARAPVLLVVDDEPGIAAAMVDAASGLGFDARAVSDWPSAAAQAATADVILLDLVMPGIDGVSALRALSEAGARARIVLVSGLDSRVIDSARRVARMQKLDVVATLRKPFRLADLRGVLAGLIASPGAAPPASAPVVAASLGMEELRRAIADDSIVLAFQPQFRLLDRAWVGIEALARLQHPRRGLLGPECFIAAVEQSDLALPFTYAVIRRALATLATLTRDCGFAGRLAVNVPPSALTTADFPDRVLALLAQADISPARFTVEITETSIATNPTLSLDIQTRLRMHGIRLAIDDFGSGHSSLMRLHEAPFDEMKLDMALVTNAHREAGLRKIVKNTVALARSLAMTVVAEGVETQPILAWLAAIGCDIAQGYHLARPMQLDVLRSWAESRPGRR